MKRICYLVVSLVLTACKKAPYDNAAAFDALQLPAATQTGAGTLACRLDGRLWMPFGKREQKGGIIGSYWSQNSLSIGSTGLRGRHPSYAMQGGMTRWAKGKVTADSNFGLFVVAFDTLGGQRPLLLRRGESLIYTDLLTFDRYLSREHNPVLLRVTRLDQARKVMSGTFEGYLFPENPLGTDSIHVTEGRFDVKLF